MIPEMAYPVYAMTAKPIPTILVLLSISASDMTAPAGVLTEALTSVSPTFLLESTDVDRSESSSF